MTATTALLAAGLSVGSALAAPVSGGTLDCAPLTMAAVPAGKAVRDPHDLTRPRSPRCRRRSRRAWPQPGVDWKQYRTEAITIPVVFHVIRSGESVGQGNLTDATVKAQIAQMNKAFKGKESGPGGQDRLHVHADPRRPVRPTPTGSTCPARARTRSR